MPKAYPRRGLEAHEVWPQRKRKVEPQILAKITIILAKVNPFGVITLRVTSFHAHTFIMCTP